MRRGSSEHGPSFTTKEVSAQMLGVVFTRQMFFVSDALRFFHASNVKFRVRVCAPSRHRLFHHTSVGGRSLRAPSSVTERAACASRSEIPSALSR